MRNYCLLFLLFLFHLAPVQAQRCNNYPCAIAKVKKALQSKDYSAALDYLESADGYTDKNAAEIQKLRRQIFAAIEKEKEVAQRTSQDLVKANAEKIQFLSEKIQSLFEAAARDQTEKKFDAAFDKISTAESLGAKRDDVKAAYQSLTRSSLAGAREKTGQGEYKLALDDVNNAVKSAAKAENPALPDSISFTYQLLWNTVFDKTRRDILNSDFDAAFNKINTVYGLKDSLETTLSLYFEIAFCYTETGRFDRAAGIFYTIAQIQNNKNLSPLLKDRAGKTPAQQMETLRKASRLLDPELHTRFSDKYFPKDLVKIPAGTYNMGYASGNGTNGQGTCPATVNGFLLSPKEVTFYEYDLFCVATKRRKPSDNGWGRGPRPVVDVKWRDAAEYCNWRSRQEGLVEVYRGDTCNWSANGYRLPTEAEWEFAAGNGAKHTRYSWGNELPGAARGGNVPDKIIKDSFPAWEVFSGYSDGFAYTAPAGFFAPNDFGLYDMSGNVWEWCWDGLTKDNCNSKAMQVSAPGTERALRGGSWGSYPKDCLVGSRFYADPGKHNFSIGFRLARNRSGM
jgi:formylglycine-generating enzyme required for sulfatase activity